MREHYDCSWRAGYGTVAVSSLLLATSLWRAHEVSDCSAYILSDMNLFADVAESGPRIFKLPVSGFHFMLSLPFPQASRSQAANGVARLSAHDILVGVAQKEFGVDHLVVEDHGADGVGHRERRPQPGHIGYMCPGEAMHRCKGNETDWSKAGLIIVDNGNELAAGSFREQMSISTQHIIEAANDSQLVIKTGTPPDSEDFDDLANGLTGGISETYKWGDRFTPLGHNITFKKRSGSPKVEHALDHVTAFLDDESKQKTDRLRVTTSTRTSAEAIFVEVLRVLVDRMGYAREEALKFVGKLHSGLQDDSTWECHTADELKDPASNVRVLIGSALLGTQGTLLATDVLVHRMPDDREHVAMVKLRPSLALLKQCGTLPRASRGI